MALPSDQKLSPDLSQVDPAEETVRASLDETAVHSAYRPDAKKSAEEPLAGRYRLIRKLGEGGMAAVYQAEDTERGKDVALKIPQLVTSDDALVKRFHREGRAIAAVAHPNVCGFHGIDQHKGRLFMTMDYIVGASLDEWIQQHPEVSAEQAVAIIIKVARGIEAAHQAGVVHRDLKAANIMMTEDGEPIVTDFGMAAWTEIQETVLTPSGAMVGTPGYMAPEQITGEKDKIGPTTDVYSLGVLLYELLTGWMPFSGNLATLLGSVVSDPPPPPSARMAGIDQRLEAVCLRALEKAPEDRWPTAAAFADALEACLAGDSAGAAGRDDQAKPTNSPADPPAGPGFFGKIFGAVRRTKT